MRRRFKVFAVSVLTFLALVILAVVLLPLGADPTQETARAEIVVGERVVNEVPVLVTQQQKTYVPLEAVFRAVGYRLESRERTGEILIGGTGVEYRLHPASGRVENGVSRFSLPDAVKIRKDQPFVSIHTLRRAFDLPLKKESDQIRIEKIRHPDPNGLVPQALPDIDTDVLIRYAHTFQGTEYVFGAEYEDSGAFDCSSFVQYVFARFDVDLPRSSRQQSRVGRRVVEEKLRTGDLLFFYVPSQGEDSDVVGHVAIYAGDGKIIHTYKPGIGVTVDQWENTGFHDTFLFAKRVVR